MALIALSFDYDAPSGYRMSRSPQIRKRSQDADQRGADALLKVLAEYDVRVTFGVVAEVALDGQPPEHCPSQIRAIHAAGHEIASHSMGHAYLPALRNRLLEENLSESKQVLESCLHQPGAVRGLIPPFNQPRHLPSRGCFSFSEVLGLGGVHTRAGWTPGRQSIGSVARVARRCGYGWYRVHLQSKWVQLKQRLGLDQRARPLQPFLLRDIVAIPMHVTGFGKPVRDLIEDHASTNLVLVAYGHPNRALAANHDESAEELVKLFEFCDHRRAQGMVQFSTMGEIEQMTRHRSSQPTGVSKV